MRLFHVAACHLPTKMLLAQHRTLHLIMSACAKGSGKGGVACYLNSAGFVALMHYDCVRELAVRGMKHNSPMEEEYRSVKPIRRGTQIHIPTSRIALDVSDLRRRIQSRTDMQDARVPLATAENSLHRVVTGVILTMDMLKS